MLAATSTMLPLGTPAPSYALPDPSGRVHRLEDVADAPALLVMFICNHCPYVKHVQADLARIGADLQARGVAVVAINSNDADAYPDDSPERMAAEAERVGYPFPYLVDADQEAARAYRAACTPDFFLFDGDRRLAYRGQLDDSRPGNGRPVSGADILAAVDAVLGGAPAPEPQHPSMGCSIKWKPGNEPDWS